MTHTEKNKIIEALHELLKESKERIQEMLAHELTESCETIAHTLKHKYEAIKQTIEEKEKLELSNIQEDNLKEFLKHHSEAIFEINLHMRHVAHHLHELHTLEEIEEEALAKIEALNREIEEKISALETHHHTLIQKH